jgi:hypothetical protein
VSSHIAGCGCIGAGQSTHRRLLRPFRDADLMTSGSHFYTIESDEPVMVKQLPSTPSRVDSAMR